MQYLMVLTVENSIQTAENLSVIAICYIGIIQHLRGFVYAIVITDLFIFI